ncbi:OsmC family protein [Alloalcanivorax sp.]|jgi:organic hydroperoxide reductase OsmC/OhrA|uniref:OsmC family protein n=2 Tax=Alloalcanivorax TaxID=3020832 RepID=UPI000799B2A4|nr:MAG: osmotically inducible protein OsmC [Alcanivorax sp. Nap_24]MAD71217.1 osmotically inducible protein OsmC [Alcanivorax sp.]MEA3259185.1 OsmC family protein [Pseudomonadota bacterium]MAQ33363.1 osmotically inducible protein OsmC [Alcanivorax sp.]MBF48196.1 osmotically inducible protein OsmC [Alcanivorax sp.]|tara:strand:- start:1 stop:450 length:450 start_codon:yes stop_codon:yes gene_type:complete
MSEYGATVAWHLPPQASFDYETFDRSHEWTFAGGEVVQASGSPEYFGTASRVNPDEAVIAATASCHMLTFLSIAAKQRLRVLSYVDRPHGVVEKNAEGRFAITRINLRPKVVFEEDVDAAALAKLHESAHRNCFVANSLRSEVTVEPES